MVGYFNHLIGSKSSSLNKDQSDTESDFHVKYFSRTRRLYVYTPVVFRLTTLYSIVSCALAECVRCTSRKRIFTLGTELFVMHTPKCVGNKGRRPIGQRSEGNFCSIYYVPILFSVMIKGQISQQSTVVHHCSRHSLENGIAAKKYLFLFNFLRYASSKVLLM